MKLDVFQCDLCKAEHREDGRARLSMFREWLKASGFVFEYKDLCEACEAEIKKTIERIKK